MAEEKKKPSFKKIMAADAMKKVMANHFYDLNNAVKAGGPKIAWCTSVGPAELLRAMGFLVYFPENHGAVLGATRTAMDYIPIANAVGYSPEICSYLTSDVGAYLKGETPLSKQYKEITSVPKPDVLVYNTNQCRDVKDWFQWYGRRLNVPCVGIETFRNIGDVGADEVKAISAQIQELVPTLEKISGAKLDIDKLREVVGLSRRCSDLWKAVLETAAAIPSPFTFFDGTIHMGPAVVARGTQEAVDYYELLLPELKKRIADGVSAVEGEKHRIYWDGMPVWGKLRELSTLFLEQQACVVASTYCNSWVFTALDAKDPFDSMARAYTELFIVRSDDAKEKYIERMRELFKFDGILFHDSKTCPNNSNNRYGMPQRLAEKLHIPSVVIHGDLNDLRCYSEEQAVTQIEAFIEQLEGKK
ncbi:MAG: 2-hydroxyacyl-CoA dehydratase family protein [Proteobacteria bacterium]|jgi:benzoyl-CoA reductase/2-hydroxyglutaryl-CoA dehydratase subunit BcrC/BadD/HgdB|nr:2-hydroxyacyl-CoA dehydratase family protein [Pseudomonadota bacterium]